MEDILNNGHSRVYNDLSYASNDEHFILDDELTMSTFTIVESGNYLRVNQFSSSIIQILTKVNDLIFFSFEEKSNFLIL